MIHTHYVYDGARIERVFEEVDSEEPPDYPEGSRRNFEDFEGMFELRRWSENDRMGWWGRAD